MILLQWEFVLTARKQYMLMIEKTFWVGAYV